MLTKSRKNIADRIASGGAFCYMDLIDLDKEDLAEIICAYDVTLWLYHKEHHREVSEEVAKCVEDYWKSEEEDE